MYQIIELAHKMIKERIKEGDIWIDATCGNGNDTLFLASLVGESGHIYAYDIQEQAINNAKKLTNAFSNITYIKASHETITESKIDGIIFNLGYLPHGDKNITTKANSTIAAIENLISKFFDNPNMIIIVVVYPGHANGLVESTELLAYLKTLNAHDYLVSQYCSLNQNQSPYLLSIVRKN